MTRKRKSVIAITAVSLALLLAVGMTLAYLTDQRTAKNALRIGADGSGNKAVEIVLDEHAFRKEIDAVRVGKTTPDDYGKYTFESIVTPVDPAAAQYTGNTTDAALFNVMPAQKINKDPSIKNIGAGPVYIRFKLQTTDASGNPVDIKQGDGVHKLLTQSPTAAAVADMGFGLVIDTTKFVYNTDGYYYYHTGVVTTPKVFNTTDTLDLFKENASGAYTMQAPIKLDYADLAAFGKEFNVHVVAEALQTEGVKAQIPWEGVDIAGPITAHPQP